MSGFIRKAPAGSAVSELDFYGQPAVDTPPLAYRELLDAGPVVWLPRHKVLAVARFAPLRAMLKADKDFVSSQGVTMNPIFNWGAKKSDTVLVSDGDKHDRLRRVLMAPMRPRALAPSRACATGSANKHRNASMASSVAGNSRRWNPWPAISPFQSWRISWDYRTPSEKK